MRALHERKIFKSIKFNSIDVVMNVQRSKLEFDGVQHTLLPPFPYR